MSAAQESVRISTEQLVYEAVEARIQAESVEGEASPSRWREADAYLALSEQGWSTRKIADACGSNKSSVALFINCAKACPTSGTRMSFWSAFSEARSGAHVSNNSGENEWYTPVEYIEAARAVMGTIDLDPASTAEANAIVGAATFYTVADDGLAQAWVGRVWMNPPYARPLIDDFCGKLADNYAQGDVTEACVLVNNATDTGWFHALAEVSAAICFPRGRVKFWHPERESAPLQGQAVIYMGPRIQPFRTWFTEFGFTVTL